MNKTKWYLSTWFICILFSFWFLIIPLILGFIFLFLQNRERLKEYNDMNTYIRKKEKEFIAKLKSLEKREKNFISQINEKQKEIAIFLISQQIKLIALKKKTYEELEKYFEQREKELVIQIAQKQEELSNIEKAIIERKQKLKDVFKRKHKKIEKLKSQIKALKSELINLEDESLYQSFGIYQRKYHYDSSEEYKKSLDLVRQKQKHVTVK